jgi:hypothetical protein
VSFPAGFFLGLSSGFFNGNSDPERPGVLMRPIDQESPPRTAMVAGADRVPEKMTGFK